MQVTRLYCSVQATVLRFTYAALGIATAALAAAACDPDVALSASNLEITPNPAQPGQAVSFAFTLTVLPGQGFTLIVLIDGAEHTRFTRSEAVNGPVVLDLGDAAALITRYGLGTHLGAIEVRLQEQNRTVGTAARAFELQNAPTPADLLAPPAARGRGRADRR